MAMMQIQMAEALPLIGADQIGERGNGMIAAIIDSGLSPHTQIDDSRVVWRYNTLDGSSDVSDNDGHGTLLTGIIGSSGIAGHPKGMCPECKLVVIKIPFFSSPKKPDSVRSGGASTAHLIDALSFLRNNKEAIEYKAGDGYKLGAVSLAFSTDEPMLDNQPYASSMALYEIEKLRQLGVLTAAGAGNTFLIHPGQQGMGWPAIDPRCVSVGAVFDAPERLGNPPGVCAERGAVRAGEITCYSNRLLVGSAFDTKLFAPGSVITSTSDAGPNCFADIEGTSPATPFVAGAVLLLQEAYRKRYGIMPTADDVERRLIESASIMNWQDAGRSYPYRLLNIARAIGQLKNEPPVA